MERTPMGLLERGLRERKNMEVWTLREQYLISPLVASPIWWAVTTRGVLGPLMMVNRDALTYMLFRSFLYEGITFAHVPEHKRLYCGLYNESTAVRTIQRAFRNWSFRRNSKHVLAKARVLEELRLLPAKVLGLTWFEGGHTYKRLRDKYTPRPYDTTQS
jgi:hypothetical protein